MTVFTTFQDAAHAARDMAIEQQQTVYVLRVPNESWDISSDRVDSQNSSNASPEPDYYPFTGKPAVVAPDWEDPPF